MTTQSVTLGRSSNQARALGEFAIDFMAGKFPPPKASVFERLDLFHLDSVCCAVSALAMKTNAPTVLKKEALSYPIQEKGTGATCFGSTQRVSPEKAILANCAAVREWDSNGTNFGFNPDQNATAGEFGHNDFYPVAIAAAQAKGLDGFHASLGMLLIDEIRGRLAEVFSLKDKKIDHVLHGAIASTAVYGAMTGADARQIESALGLLIAHYVPYRAIRSGKQLSDSKGASAAISTEMGIVSLHRAARGFAGPADIFRNRQAIFCLANPPDAENESPFDLTLTCGGEKFALFDMHFKLGLYEHQSAGAIQAVIELLQKYPKLLTDGRFPDHIEITIYEPAFSIICDPAKKNPQTRQTADHSMLFIIASLLEKAYRSQATSWEDLMLLPADYTMDQINNPTIRSLMDKIHVRHGGSSFDRKYPKGIPTSIRLRHNDLGTLESGLIMYPLGHSRSNFSATKEILHVKMHQLASLGVEQPHAMMSRFTDLRNASAQEIQALYSFDILDG